MCFELDVFNYSKLDLTCFLYRMDVINWLINLVSYLLIK